MEGRSQKRKWVEMLLLAMIAVYLAGAALVNFSVTPGFYDADMYSDVLYSMKAWEEKTIFPQRWIFGNQRNAVSAPVLAAGLYGLLGDPFLSMALATTVMGILTLWSLDWMVRPALQNRRQRLICLTVFMAVALYYGGVVTDNRGWTLFFTMCSYYAGYSITAFLAFGCYLRSGRGFTRGLAALLALTAVLSFGTGIQSIRQTAVMVVPLAAAEVLRIAHSVKHRKPLEKSRLLTAAVVGAANVAGVIYSGQIQINQVEILGSIQLRGISQWPGALLDSLLVLFRLLINSDKISYFMLAGLLLICAAALPGFWKQLRGKCPADSLPLFFLLAASVLVIMGVAVLTTMQVWGRYYFMIYPLIGFLAACCYESSQKAGKTAVILFLILLFTLSCVQELLPAALEIQKKEQDPAYEVCEYLQDHDYDCLFTIWGHGEGVAVVSEAEIMVGFWDLVEVPFKPMGYLYDPVILEASPERCAYLLDGQEAVDYAQKAALAAGAQWELVHYFEEYDWYLFEASINLMNAYS